MNDSIRKIAQQDGVLVLNKPSGPTSAACIGMIKRRLGQNKIGHAGTLDPMANGVLLVLLGQATKISGPLLSEGKKIYGATIKFGINTDTWDADGTVVSEAAPKAVSVMVGHEELKQSIAAWVGELEQEVPPYSAAKHQGKPLYKLARMGLEIPVKKKIIEISRAELEWFEPPLARFRVACSSGTYIRSLAHSLGTRFECGATLMELTREYSHPFGLEDSIDLDAVLETPGLLQQKLHDIAEALPAYPKLRLSWQQMLNVKNGARLSVRELPDCEAGQALFLSEDGSALALAERCAADGGLYWRVGRGLWNTNS